MRGPWKCWVPATSSCIRWQAPGTVRGSTSVSPDSLVRPPRESFEYRNLTLEMRKAAKSVRQKALAPALEAVPTRRFAKGAPASYLQAMPSKPIDLPPEVAKAFVRDMRAFFKEENAIKRDEIAGRQLFALSAFQCPRDKKLRSRFTSTTC